MRDTHKKSNPRGNVTRTMSCASLKVEITPRSGGSGGGVCIRESLEEVGFELGLEERVGFKNV